MLKFLIIISLACNSIIALTAAYVVKRNIELRKQVYFDNEIPGLLTQKGLKYQLDRNLPRWTFVSSRQDSPRFCTVVFSIDANGLKLINDTAGHAIGDLMLEKIAKGLIASTRPGDLVARVGGDEYTVVLHYVDQGNPKANRQIAEKIRQKMKQKTRGSIQGALFSTSIGYEFLQPGELDINRAFDVADERMYSDKRAQK